MKSQKRIEGHLELIGEAEVSSKPVNDLIERQARMETLLLALVNTILGES